MILYEEKGGALDSTSARLQLGSPKQGPHWCNNQSLLKGIFSPPPAPSNDLTGKLNQQQRTETNRNKSGKRMVA